MFSDRASDDLAQEGLGDETCFGMIRCRGRNRASPAADNVGAINPLETRGAPKLRQNTNRRCYSLLARSPDPFAVAASRDFATDLAHGESQLPANESSANCFEHEIEQAAVGFRKHLLDGRRRRIQDMGLSGASARAGLRDKAVALKADEVRPDSVVREPQRNCQFVDSPVVLPEQTKDLAACALEQPFAPG